MTSFFFSEAELRILSAFLVNSLAVIFHSRKYAFEIFSNIVGSSGKILRAFL